MSPILTRTSYSVACDLCSNVRPATATVAESRRYARQADWLLVGPLIICHEHEPAIDDPLCDCGSDDTYAGNCAECWRKAMELPRGACGDPSRIKYAMEEYPAHLCSCIQLVEPRYGSHPGPHQGPCGEEWGYR